MKITAEMVLQLKKELAYHHQKAQEHVLKAHAVESILEGAAVLDPDVFEAIGPESQEETSAPSGSLREVIRNVLRDAGHAMTKLGLRERVLEAGVPVAKLGNNAAYFYTVVRRMEKSGELRKYGRSLRFIK